MNLKKRKWIKQMLHDTKNDIFISKTRFRK
jgi:hypothetical protein